MANYNYLQDKELRKRLKTARDNRPAQTNSSRSSDTTLSDSPNKPRRHNEDSRSQSSSRRLIVETKPKRKRYPKPSTKDLAISTKQLASMIRLACHYWRLSTSSPAARTTNP